jgi:RNA polymerase sigma-70 factor (ECF subfamily)
MTVAEPSWDELRANLRGFIARRVGNQADVDDLVQRVLLQIVKGLGSLRDAERLHAWMYRTARNVIADHYRSPAVRREVASGDAVDIAQHERPGPASSDEDEDIAGRELAACMAPMLRQLPARYREALTLADLEGVNQADAARRVGVSLSGMKSRVQRGRKRLKLLLEACCQLELDRRGGVVGFERRETDCGHGDGCACTPCSPRSQ